MSAKGKDGFESVRLTDISTHWAGGWGVCVGSEPTSSSTKRDKGREGK